MSYKDDILANIINNIIKNFYEDDYHNYQYDVDENLPNVWNIFVKYTLESYSEAYLSYKSERGDLHAHAELYVIHILKMLKNIGYIFP